MQEKLIIFLPSDVAALPSWAVVNAENKVSDHTSQGAPQHLAQLARDKTVIVIVSAEDVLLTQVTLPKMSRSRLLQAIPFALEEQLIGDVDTLHIAAGGANANGSLPVAVVAKEKMTAWLAQLKDWQITPHSLVPVSMALPVEENTWHAAIYPAASAAVRMRLYQGTGCDPQNLATLLAWHIHAQKEEMPTHVCIRDYTQQMTEAAFANFPVHIILEEAPSEQFISDLAASVTRFPVLNLLQGTYASKQSRFPQKQKIWRSMMYLAIAWLALMFLYPTLSYFILRGRVNSINTEIEQIYKRNFPQSTSMVAPKLRMEGKLQKLSTDVGENRILLLLGYVGEALTVAPNIKLKRFDFQNNQLTLGLTAASSDDVSAFSDALTKQALSVKQENVNVTDAHISATLLIE